MPPRAPQRRPVASHSGGRTLPYGLVKLLVICLIAAAAGFALQAIWPNGFPVVKAQNTGAPAVTTITEIHSNGPVRINELMSSNRDCLSIADGSSPDWIELTNISSHSVDIGGYQLSKSANSATVFTFPQLWLEPGECILVYCDSRLRETVGEDLHAPFRISSAGDTLLLFNASDTAVDTLNVPALARDHSYIRTGASTWEESAAPTPGLPNTDESYRSLNEMASDSPVIVNEVMSTNRSTLTDENGLYYDYIELYNRSGESVNLSGWYLSDDTKSTRKWRLPDVSIGSNEYLVIHASGLDRKDDPTHLHTNFSLSSEGEAVVLSNNVGRVMDRVEFDLLKADTAWLRQADGSWTAGAGTPGRQN